MRPETLAGLMNAMAVFVGPIVLLGAGGLVESCETSSSVSADDPHTSALGVVATLAGVLVPFAAVAFWRTRTLARRWIRSDAGDWQGVLEAGAVGLAVALMVLLPGTLHDPRSAPPYIAVYGTSGAILGLIVGWILRFVALTTLFRTRFDTPADR